jgi:hypothetical protein
MHMAVAVVVQVVIEVQMEAMVMVEGVLVVEEIIQEAGELDNGCMEGSMELVLRIMARLQQEE